MNEAPQPAWCSLRAPIPHLPRLLARFAFASADGARAMHAAPGTSPPPGLAGSQVRSRHHRHQARRTRGGREPTPALMDKTSRELSHSLHATRKWSLRRRSPCLPPQYFTKDHGRQRHRTDEAQARVNLRDVTCVEWRGACAAILVSWWSDPPQPLIGPGCGTHSPVRQK